MNDCIFCKIVLREIPASIVYEDDTHLAFLDINPVAIGHTLLIPKEHHRWMSDVPDELLGKTFITAKKIMQAVQRATTAGYIYVAVEGIEAPHFHVHFIPRNPDDGLRESWKKTSYKEGELSKTQDLIARSF